MYILRKSLKFVGIFGVTLTVLCLILASFFNSNPEISLLTIVKTALTRRTKSHFVVQPATCLIGKKNPIGVVLLHNSQRQLQQQLREELLKKWKRVEDECGFKVLFVAGQSPKYLDSLAHHERILQTDMIEDLELSHSNLAGIFHSWIIEHCKTVQTVIVQSNATTSSFQSDIARMVLYMFKEDDEENISTDFSECSVDIARTAEKGDLYTVVLGNIANLTFIQLDPAYANFETKYDKKYLQQLFRMPQNTPVNKGLYDFIPTEEPCKVPRQRQSPFLIIATQSALRHFDFRKKIRETWASQDILQRNNAVNLFFVGSSSDKLVQQQIAKEKDFFHDIVQADFVDSYRNLTIKHQSVLKYLSLHCQHVSYSYLLKTDDDVLLDIDSMVKFMKNISKRNDDFLSNKIFCFHMLMDEDNAVPRNRSYKWFVTPEEFPGHSYPPYCYGNGYLLTQDLVAPMYNMSLYTKLFWVDDVYFTGFVARNLNVSLIELPHQSPIYAEIEPPERILQRKRWLVHFRGDLAGTDVDDHWMAILSRWNVSIRKNFAALLRRRTGQTAADDLYDYL